MRFSLPALFAVWLLTGCVSTNAALLDPTVKYQKICPDGVAIFTSAQRVQSDYREVALLNSKGESSWTNEEGMMKSQRRKAASIGANGIIIGEVKEPNAGTKIIGSLLGTGAERKGAALAIYIPEDSARVQRACGAAGAASTAARPPSGPEATSRAIDEPRATSFAPATEAGQEASTAAEPPPVAPKATNAVTATVGIPPGMQWVGDSESKQYFPAECAAVGQVPEERRYFYPTEQGAQSDGYSRASSC